MENIKIDVTGNIARVTEKPIRITSGTVGLPVKFVFDNQWNGLRKTAVFRAGCVQKIRESLEDETTVPWEVLRKPGVWLSIGVYGVDASGTVVIPTIWANVCSIQVGASPDGDPGIDPTLPVWQRLLGEVGNLSLLRTTKKEDLVAAINEAYGEGEASHIEGINNQAIGIASHVEGISNLATDEAQHAGGKFNAPVSGPWVVGNGDETGRSNAAQMDWDGNVRFDGDVIAFGCNGKAGISLQSLHGLVGKTSVGSQIQKALDAPLEKLYASDEAELEAALSGIMGQMADGSVKSFEVLPKRVVSEDFSDVVNEGTAITAIPTVVGDSFVKWNGAAMSPNWNAWVSSGSVIVQPHIEDGNVCMKLTPRDTGRLQMVYNVPSEVYESLVDGRTYRVSARYKGEGCNFNAQMEAKASATWPVVPVGLIDGEWVTAEHEFTVDKSHGSLSLTFVIAWPGGSQGSMYLDDICLVEVITEKPFDGKSTIGQLYRANNNNAVARFATYDSAGCYMYDKILYGGAWQPLEWENPPYKFNKIYRTTERYRGYPVYAFLLSTGGFAFGNLNFTTAKGFTDDPDYVAGGWTVISYDRTVIHDGFYGAGIMESTGDYSLDKYVENIRSDFTDNGLSVTFTLKSNSNSIGNDAYMNFVVKFVKQHV